ADGALTRRRLLLPSFMFLSLCPVCVPHLNVSQNFRLSLIHAYVVHMASAVMHDELERAVDDHRLLSIPQAAKVCGISVWTLRRLIKAGKGPRITQISDRRIGITVGNLRNWQQSRERA